jgi:two-component system response regulator DesR
VIRILLAEDQHVVRAALAALLDLEEDLSVVTQCASGDDVLPRALVDLPDLAVLDIDMPGAKDGLRAAAELKARIPGIRTLILTGHGRPGLLRRALEAKADGFLLKTVPAERLIEAIREVARGGRVLDPQLAVAAWDLAGNPLTPREREVLGAAAQGAEPAEIAAQFHLSVGTVRNSLTAIVGKLHARNRTDAVRIATDAGWI